MTPPLLPTAYLPSVAYLSILSRYSSVVIEQKETFPKQTFRNRATIATGNGPLMLHVPVARPHGNHSRTEDIMLSYHEPWHIRHWRAIVSAYSAAPYFLYYRDDLEAILLQPHTHLIELNHALLCYLLQKLHIECELTYSHDFIHPSPPDLRISLVHKHSFPPQHPEAFIPYPQVFDTRNGFLPNLSAIDLLFNLGPQARTMLTQNSLQDFDLPE